MCVILVVYYTSCVCYFATSCVPSLTPSQCTVAAFFYDFADEVMLGSATFREMYPSKVEQKQTQRKEQPRPHFLNRQDTSALPIAKAKDKKLFSQSAFASRLLNNINTYVL